MSKSLKVLIKIGHYELLLPDDTGAAMVVKTLSRALVVHDRLYQKQIQLSKCDSPEVSMTYVPERTKFVDDQERPIEPLKPQYRKLMPQNVPLLVEGQPRLF